MKKALAFTLLAASCGAPREAPIASTPTAILPSPIAASDAGGRRPFDAPAIDPPALIGCTLRATQWAHPTSLRFRAGGPPYAEVAGTDAAILLGEGQPANAILDLDAHGIRVRGAVEVADVPLHLRAARLVAELFVPLASQRLLWEGATATDVTASFSIDVSVLVKAGLYARLSGACGDFALEAGHDDGFDAVGGRKLSLPMRVRSKRFVPLSGAPGGPAAAYLHFEGADADAEAAVVVMERKGGYARVAWRGRDQLAVGWVPTTELFPNVGSMGFLGREAVDPVPRSFVSVVSRQACSHEVLLVVELGGERRTVGRIAAGTEIDVVADEQASEGLTRVDLPRTSLRATAGARFVVESPSLDGCGWAGVVK